MNEQIEMYRAVQRLSWRTIRSVNGAIAYIQLWFTLRSALIAMNKLKDEKISLLEKQIHYKDRLIELLERKIQLNKTVISDET